jgi:isochorismate pyruvate lyase
MPSNNQIRCNEIPYRQGFIEVQPNIHDGFVNIETWMLNPCFNIANTKSIADLVITDADFIGNTELELTIEQTNELIIALQVAIAKIRNPSHMPKNHSPDNQQK